MLKQKKKKKKKKKKLLGYRPANMKNFFTRLRTRIKITKYKDTTFKENSNIR